MSVQTNGKSTSDKKLRILFIGDLATRDFIHEMLRQGEGTDFELVHSKVATVDLKQLSAADGDVILIDLNYPGISAPHFLSSLAAVLQSTAVVALLTESNDSLVKQVEPLNLSEHVLVKEGITPELLRRTLKQSIAARHQRVALSQSEQRYHDLFENAKDILFTIDPDGTVTSINKSAERAFGYSRSEVIGLNIRAFIAPEHAEWCNRIAQCAQQQDVPAPVEVHLMHKTGRRVIAEVTSLAIHQCGQTVGIQGIARDITERRNLESKLRQSQKMEAIIRLSGGLAHDLNNVFCVIKGHTDLIQDQLEAPHAATRSLEQIKKAADSATLLLRQLLAFGQKQPFHPVDMSLNDTISTTKKMLSRLIGEHIEIVTSLSSDLAHVHADPAQIVQVLLNLSLNARDAMPNGGKLTLETYNVDLAGAWQSKQEVIPAGRYVVLAVSDNGIGMDAETQARVFEPFYTKKEFGTRSGLGLATVYGIVKQSNGHVWVYSEPGHGTAFKIYIPRTNQLVSSIAAVLDDQKIQLGTETVLLVEDEEPLREVIKHFLTRNGYTVLEARTGVEAFELARRGTQHISLLLTDVVMPEMGGRDLAERLKSSNPDLRVLYMSGYPNDGILQAGILDGGMQYLEKPFTRDGLLRKVREVLSERVLAG
jgi:two-component system cell cycle sensor histidine kinase/response regulator CckA